MEYKGNGKHSVSELEEIVVGLLMRIMYPDLTIHPREKGEFWLNEDGRTGFVYKHNSNGDLRIKDSEGGAAYFNSQIYHNMIHGENGWKRVHPKVMLK